MNQTGLLDPADLSTSRPLDLRGYRTCTSLEYIESKSRAWSGVSLHDRTRVTAPTIVVVMGSSSVSTPEYLKSVCIEVDAGIRDLPSLDLNAAHSLPICRTGAGTIGTDVARHVFIRRGSYRGLDGLFRCP